MKAQKSANIFWNFVVTGMAANCTFLQTVACQAECLGNGRIFYICKYSTRNELEYECECPEGGG